jgi:hypothetical protein
MPFQNPFLFKVLIKSANVASFLQQQELQAEHEPQAEHESQEEHEFQAEHVLQVEHESQSLQDEQLLQDELLQDEQAANADPLNDTKNITASKRPTVILNICFPIVFTLQILY